MRKKRSKSGFTFAELLIVVAIIAVLVAIAIPVFTTQLEKSKQATDLANIRATYAAASLLFAEVGGSEGSAVSPQMKHDGLFDKLPEARIANLDLKTDDSVNAAGCIVRNATIRVTVYADGTVKLNCANYAGRRALASEISKEYRADGVCLVTEWPYKGTYYPISGSSNRKAQIGKTYYVSDYGGNSGHRIGYYLWDGEHWYYTAKEGDNWQVVK